MKKKNAQPLWLGVNLSQVPLLEPASSIERRAAIDSGLTMSVKPENGLVKALSAACLDWP